MQIFVFFIFVLFDEYKVMKIFRLMQAFLWFKKKYKKRLIGTKYTVMSSRIGNTGEFISEKQVKIKD